MGIHKTAIVAKGAKMADDIEVGPYAIIGKNVVIGKGVKIEAHCIIDGITHIGSGTRIFHHAVVGTDPQDLKFKGEATRLEIGENNTIREFVTINKGTAEGGGLTVIGDNNLFMAYAHVAHDCRVGNDVVIANLGTLGGHVVIEDRVIVGGMVGVHQFVKIGKLSIIGGHSKAIQDVPPFLAVDGHPAEPFNINVIGLERAGIPEASRKALKKAFKILFRSGLSMTHALEKLNGEAAGSTEVRYLVDFIKASKRGICR
ncbi:MAG: acyl-[acyl-carrier-protein]--UDP-N-acetylglucosamine O-acyltransferase [Candidatus Omnitrophica bacterium CG1_02_49_10]|nr:MAG: acyl-[acyl-carrier-protein]--UDP-N-acetylglucosamine O-acyltransferase [Candidatus Omnitrophica bacterium CG1_02_49_10]